MYHRNAIVLKLMKVVMVHASFAELQLIEGKSFVQRVVRYRSQVT